MVKFYSDAEFKNEIQDYGSFFKDINISIFKSNDFTDSYNVYVKADNGEQDLHFALLANESDPKMKRFDATMPDGKITKNYNARRNGSKGSHGGFLFVFNDITGLAAGDFLYCNQSSLLVKILSIQEKTLELSADDNNSQDFVFTNLFAVNDGAKITINRAVGPTDFSGNIYLGASLFLAWSPQN